MTNDSLHVRNFIVESEPTDTENGFARFWMEGPIDKKTLDGFRKLLNIHFNNHTEIATDVAIPAQTFLKVLKHCHFRLE